MSDNSPKDENAPAKKLSPLEAKKQLQAQQRQGLQTKTKGVQAARDGGETAGNSDAPPPRTNTPRRAGGS